MRVCLVAPFINRLGGTERCFAELTDNLSKDNEITIFANSISDLNTVNYRFYNIPIIKTPGIFSFLSFFLFNNFLMLFKRRDFDIIHSSGADSAFADIITLHFCQKTRNRLQKNGSIAFLNGWGKPFLRKLHYYIYSDIVSCMEKFVLTRKNVKSLIAVSENVKEDVVNSYGIDPSKISVIYNTVDLEEFDSGENHASRVEIRSRLCISDNETVFLFVGGDWERKGLDKALFAFSKLSSSGVKFLVAGHGDFKTFRKLCHNLSISDRVIFTGHTKNVRLIYHAADIFVFPSIYEPFGIAPLEALVCGLPVIISKNCGFSELLEDGEDCLMIKDPQNTDEIASLMKRLLEDDYLVKKLSKGFLRRADKVDMASNYSKTIEVYKKILGSKRGISIR